MINTRVDLCDLCNRSGATKFLDVPTGLQGIDHLTVRLCPDCKHTLLVRSDTIIPVFDTVVRALGMLRDMYQLTPLPSSDALQAERAGAKPEVGPQA